MFKKDARNELKAFGLLLGFMTLCGTMGTLFLSKIILLLSNVSFLGGLFIFLLFVSVLGGLGYGLYLLGRKIVPALTGIFASIAPQFEKLMIFFKNKKDLYYEEARTNGFISSFKWTNKFTKKEK